MRHLFFFSIFLFNFQFSHSQNPSHFELHLTKGDSFNVEIIEASDTEQLVMGEEQKIKKTDSYSFLLSLDSLPTDSSYYFRATYKHFKSVFDRDDYSEVFDTDSISNTLNPEISFFRSLIGKSFFFEIDKTGNVLKFENLENIFRSSSIIELNQRSGVMLQKKYGSECIQNTVFSLKFPEEKKLQVNNWLIADTAYSGILKICDRSVIVTEETDSICNTTIKANILTDPNIHIKTNNVYIVYNMAGKQSGTVDLYRRSCFLKQSYQKQYISGSAGMKYSVNSGLAYTWPIKITNTITCKVTKINSHEE